MDVIVENTDSKEAQLKEVAFTVEEELTRVPISMDVIVENIDSKEGQLKDVAFTVEQELSRVRLDHELNYSDMAGADESKINNAVVGDKASVAKLGVLDNGVKENVEIVNNDGDEKVEALNNKAESGSESETESESESESESSGSSSSSSDSSSDEDDDDDDDDDEEPKRITDVAGVEREMEEGELPEADDMVAWSDDEDEGGNATKGPIRSKNEIADLPPVPAVTVSLLPHHNTLPVGIVLSIMGAQVVVEGVEKHNPLNEGSILWITQSRSPLGVVDEIFGPVKNPYYIVRYNSETEVPAGVQPGTQISFVQEFADHVLNNASLYRKGYDASNEYDEELSEEAEFSDDEKEAEYRRLQKMKKRGTNDNKGEDRKKDNRKTKNRGVGKHEQSTAKQTHDFANKVSTQNFVPEQSTAAKQTHDFANNVSTQHFVPPPGGGFPINPQMQGMPWFQGNQPFAQTPFPNMAQFQQNMQMNQSLAFGSFPPNFLNQALFGMGMQDNSLALTNFGANPGPFNGLQNGGVPQNFINQSILGMGMQGQNASQPTNVGANAVSSNGFQQMTTSNPGLQNFNPGNLGQDGFQNFNPGTPGQNFNPGQGDFQNFNPGGHRGGGRSPHRGGGRFGGGRGRRGS